jgi:transglutaminase-like putative cysteine protease
MKEEDLLKEAKEIEKEIERDKEEISLLKSPWFYAVAVLIVLVFVLAIFPPYSIRADPEPRNIPKLADLNLKFDDAAYNHTLNRRDDILSFLQPSDPVVKQTADSIVLKSCSESNTCYAKAIFYFVRDNFQYISDPPNDYVKGPRETLKQPSGDCDDNAVLLANLLEAVGIRTRFVFIPQHVFVQAYIEDAKSRYKEKDGWISLDATCKNCNFADIPAGNRAFKWEYVD